MSIEDIVFKPYDDNNIQEIVDAIDKYLINSQPEDLFEKIVNRIYFDNSIGWKRVLTKLLNTHSFIDIIPEHYRNLINEHRNDIVPQYTYFITFLIANNLLSEDVIDSGLLENLPNGEAKYILFSFLASWNLEKCLDLDYNYTAQNFSHLIDAKNAPIKNLILNSNEESTYSIIKTVIADGAVQFHFNQEIQKIIAKNNPDDLNRLEYFVNKCNCDNHEHIQEFICDLFELSSVQSFLNNRWNIRLTEKIYKNFSSSHSLMTDFSKKNSLITLNRLKRRQQSNFAIAARHEINRLSDNDKLFIIKSVETESSKDIDEFIDTTIIPNTGNWDWKDYAHFIVRYFKDKHTDKEKINFLELGKTLGIEVVIRDFETENFDACLARDVTLKSPIIFVNSFKKSTGRINFSIAHELGHAVIPHHAKSNFFCFLEDVTESNRFVMNKQLEIEANLFASYLLLPDKQFKEEVLKLDYTMRNVNFLSRKFGASLVLVAKKWVELSNLDIAMTFSTNGIIDWACTSDNFPFSWVDNIDPTSTVFKAINSSERKSVRKKVYSTKWFNKDYPQFRLQEESVKLYDGKVLTLLQVIEDL